MSWFISIAGNTEELVKSLEQHSESLDGMSKIEFDAALPHIVGLVKQNFDNDQNKLPLLSVEASGHGWDTYRQCVVSIKHFIPEQPNEVSNG